MARLGLAKRFLLQFCPRFLDHKVVKVAGIKNCAGLPSDLVKAADAAALNGEGGDVKVKVLSCSDVDFARESDDDRLLDLAREGAGALSAGGVVAVPTDTIYGLAALAQDDRAVEALYSIKGRDKSKPIAISVADVDDVYKVSVRQ